MKTRRLKAPSLLRGLGKLAAVGALAGGAGLAIGLGLSHLSGSTIASTPPPATSPTSTAGSPAAPAAATPPTAGRQVRVRVLSVVLHPASTPAGRQRQRARLIVRIAARNRGPQLVTPTRPVLIAAGVGTRTDPHADAPATRLGPIAPGATETVSLQFEVAGAVTAQLTGRRSARVFVIGRSVPIAVKVGGPVAAPAAARP